MIWKLQERLYFKFLLFGFALLAKLQTDNSNNAYSQEPIITYEDIHSKTSAEITEQSKKEKHTNNKKNKKSVREEPKDGSNEESQSPTQGGMAATKCTIKATNKVNKSESNDNTNMNNTAMRTNQGDQSSSQTQRETRTTIICGDSMVKNIKSWKLKRSCDKGENMLVNSFPGGNVHEMMFTNCAQTLCREYKNRLPTAKYKFIRNKGSNIKEIVIFVKHSPCGFI